MGVQSAWEDVGLPRVARHTVYLNRLQVCRHSYTHIISVPFTLASRQTRADVEPRNSEVGLLFETEGRDDISRHTELLVP